MNWVIADYFFWFIFLMIFWVERKKEYLIAIAIAIVFVFLAIYENRGTLCNKGLIFGFRL
jgi:asparagine N-glycosylation enzyme membrane subunit Stt3